jgi:phage tail tape-measure protein
MQERRGRIAILFCAMIALGGCETMQSNTAKGAAVGGLLGAGTGAIIGEQTGKAGAGTAIGAGLGALAGGVMGKALDNSEKNAARQNYPSTVPQQTSNKFCPVGGEKYGAEVTYCPIHGVELKYLQ